MNVWWGDVSVCSLQEWTEYDEKGEEAVTMMGLKAEFRLHK
jgi:hypothetical protein